MGTSETHDELFRSVHELCDAAVGERSIFRLQSKSGRTIKLHPKHETLDRHRKRQRDEAWKKQYRKVRPRVERKLAHLMRRKHGGRRARVRGRERVKHDFALLAASINLARLAALGVRIAPAAKGA